MVSYISVLDLKCYSWISEAIIITIIFSIERAIERKWDDQS